MSSQHVVNSGDPSSPTGTTPVVGTPISAFPLGLQNVQHLHAQQQHQSPLHQSVSDGSGGYDNLNVAAMSQQQQEHSQQTPQLHVRRLRRKVMFLSVGSAVLLFVGGIIGYAFNLQNDLSLIQWLQDQGIIDTKHEHGPHGPHRFLLMFFAGLPFVLLGLLVALCVPGCGYLGAKHLNSRLLACFWGCSACNAACGLIGALIIFWAMAAGAPMAEHWLEVCDVANVCCGEQGQFCIKNEENSTSLPLPEFEKQFLDCVMAAHPGYESQFPRDNQHPRLKRGMCVGSARIATKCDHHGKGREDHPPPISDEELDEELHRFGHRFPAKHWYHHTKTGEPFQRYLSAFDQLPFSANELDRPIFEFKEAPPHDSSDLSLEELAKETARQVGKKSGHQLPEVTPKLAADFFERVPPFHGKGHRGGAHQHHPPEGQHHRGPHRPRPPPINKWGGLLDRLFGGRGGGKVTQDVNPNNIENDIDGAIDSTTIGRVGPLGGHRGGGHNINVGDINANFERENWLKIHNMAPEEREAWLEKYRKEAPEKVEWYKQGLEEYGDQLGKPDLKKSLRDIGDLVLKKRNDPKFREAVKEKWEKGLTPGEEKRMSQWVERKKKGAENMMARRHHRHSHDQEWFKTCELNPKAVTVMHTISQKLPELISEIELVILLKFLIGVPGILLSFFASYYGFKLWRRAKRGYRYVTADGQLLAISSQQDYYGNNNNSGPTAGGVFGTAFSSQQEGSTGNINATSGNVVQQPTYPLYPAMGDLAQPMMQQSMANGQQQQSTVLTPRMYDATRLYYASYEGVSAAAPAGPPAPARLVAVSNGREVVAAPINPQAGPTGRRYPLLMPCGVPPGYVAASSHTGSSTANIVAGAGSSGTQPNSSTQPSTTEPTVVTTQPPQLA